MFPKRVDDFQGLCSFTFLVRPGLAFFAAATPATSFVARDAALKSRTTARLIANIRAHIDRIFQAFTFEETTMKAIYRTATPYPKDAMNLPVGDVETAISFYETIMGFQVLSRKDSPSKSVVLGRDGIQIGLAENGGDPTQEGCFFEVDNAEAAFAELKSNGLEREEAWSSS